MDLTIDQRVGEPASLKRARRATRTTIPATGQFQAMRALDEANAAKHGIDFTEALKLWDDARRLEIPARTTDEPRFIVIGKIAGKYWSAVITYRKDKTRIVSARRARPEEEKLYEGEGE